MPSCTVERKEDVELHCGVGKSMNVVVSVARICTNVHKNHAVGKASTTLSVHATSCLEKKSP